MIKTGLGGQAVLGAISNSSRENALGPRFESRLGHECLHNTIAIINFLCLAGITWICMSPVSPIFHIVSTVNS